jgi:hypothetical protein
MDRREHHRVQLRLPARLRWATPFGQKIEICQTVNVSRGGALVPCEEAHVEGMSLWVTFPYDPAISYGQPEISAKVVRFVGSAQQAMGDAGTNANGARRMFSVGERQSIATAGKASGAAPQLLEASHTRVAALRFEVTRRHRANSNGNGHRREVERRASPRQQLAVPVRVRPEHVPWFEETMSIDCCAEGLKFRSNREYTPGQFLVISFESADNSPWPVATELVLMVARIEKMPQSPALNVAVCRSGQFSLRF